MSNHMNIIGNKCIVCSNFFDREIIKIRTGKYCSEYCRRKGGRIEKKCTICRKKYSVRRCRSESKVCSVECHAKNQQRKSFWLTSNREQINERVKKDLAKKSKKLENGCIEWLGSQQTNGYGNITYFGSSVRVHRLAYMYHNNDWDISPSDFICHTCDFPMCIAKEHLYKGDPLLNARDRVKRGRSKYGRFKKSELIEIRKLLSQKIKIKDIAKKFDVTNMTIEHIKRNKSYINIIDKD
jgi:hypothetical protein